MIIAVLAGVGIWLVHLRTTNNHRRPRQTPPHRQPRHQPATVPPDRLDSILLSTAQISTIMDAPNIQARPLENGLKPSYSAVHAVEPRVASGRWLRRQLPGVCKAADTREAKLQGLQEQPGASGHLALQGAVAFPSADQADAFVKESATKWTACAGQTVTETTNSGQTLTFTFGSLTGDATKITQLLTRQGRRDVSASAQRGIQRDHRRRGLRPKHHR